MKKTLLFIALSLFVAEGFAASKKGKDQGAYQFEDIKLNEVTSVKSQGRTGTCWCFSTIAMLESDIIKSGKGAHDLSEMWVVRYTYLNKAIQYVRTHGKGNLSQGGNAHDVTDVIAEYGIVPEEIYEGLNYGTTIHAHSELEGAIVGYVNAIVANRNKELSTAWIAGLNGILDAYFGKAPEKFTYQGKEYTPMSFAAAMGVDPKNYISITSFTHHPYKTAFPLEIPDNWAWKPSYNVPFDEFEPVLDEIINSGYTIYWGSDVSEKGYAYTKGFAVFPETDIEAIDDMEKSRWVELTPEELSAQILKLDAAVPEKKVTAEMRQMWFDNYTTTDDHGMQIYGIAKDQNGNKFYKVKNSWGTGNLYKGHFYTSVPFILGKTTNYFVNKNALSSATRKRLGIE